MKHPEFSKRKFGMFYIIFLGDTYKIKGLRKSLLFSDYRLL